MAATTAGTVRAAASAGPARRHGGGRAPRLRAQDQQVARPPGPSRGHPHVSGPRPGVARPSPAPASPSPFKPLPPGPTPARLLWRGPGAAGGGEGGGGPRWGRGGAASAMAAERRSALGAAGGGVGACPGAFLEAVARGEQVSGALRVPRHLRVLPGSPSPRAREQEGLWRPILLPGAGLGCSWGRDLGTGMVILEALEAPREGSRALPPLPGSRAQLSGEQGTAVDGPHPQPCFRLSQHRLDALEMDG